MAIARIFCVLLTILSFSSPLLAEGGEATPKDVLIKAADAFEAGDSDAFAKLMLAKTAEEKAAAATLARMIVELPPKYRGVLQKIEQKFGKEATDHPLGTHSLMLAVVSSPRQMRELRDLADKGTVVISGDSAQITFKKGEGQAISTAVFLHEGRWYFPGSPPDSGKLIEKIGLFVEKAGAIVDQAASFEEFNAKLKPLLAELAGGASK